MPAARSSNPCLLRPANSIPSTIIWLRFRISYDPVMEADMSFVDGCYRLPSKFWQVFVFLKKDVTELRHSEDKWESGITGVTIDVPAR